MREQVFLNLSSIFYMLLFYLFTSQMLNPSLNSSPHPHSENASPPPTHTQHPLTLGHHVSKGVCLSSPTEARQGSLLLHNCWGP